MRGREEKMTGGVGHEGNALADVGPASAFWLAESVGAIATVPPALSHGAREPWRVLLLVGDTDLGEWLMEELRLLHAAVALSTNGRDGLELARSGLVDVVISEMGLPDLPGMDLLRELRAGPKMPKVILTTSRHSDFLAKRAIEDGASAVLAKPFRIEQLIALLTSVLGN